MTKFQRVYSRNSGLKMTTVLVNKTYMSEDWPKDFLDSTVIVLQKKNEAKSAVATKKIV